MEKNVMREILIEMEHLLFSDSKVKILAIDATGNPELDKSKLEGINVIIKKYIREFYCISICRLKKTASNPAARRLSG